MLAEVRAAAVVLLAAVHNLHLNSVTLFPIGAQLIGGVADARVGAQSVVAAVSAVGFSLTLVNIFAGFPVVSEDVTQLTVTVSFAAVHLTDVSAASVLLRARVLQFAVLAVLGQDVVRFAPAAEMSDGLLHTVVFAPSVTDGTRMDGEAGSAVHVQP